MMCRVISQMAPLAQRPEIDVCAIFRLMIKMRDSQDDECICNRVAFTMPSAAGLETGDAFTRVSRAFLYPLANLAPVRWIPASLTHSNWHGLYGSVKPEAHTGAPSDPSSYRR